MEKAIDISEFDYPLPDERIARFPLEDRAASKLLLYRNGTVGEDVFRNVADYLPAGALVVFNDTKVIRARLLFHKATGARIEIFCLEPHAPADYERAFAVTGRCEWHCIVGNSKKWKSGPLEMPYDGGILSAERIQDDRIGFAWTSEHTFGQLLELLGRTPIPPYLCRESEEIDTVRYQTVYSKWEGSVAAPTAGLHFTSEIIESLSGRGFDTAEVTLHVGAGTFLPVKEKDARNHRMHTEFFQVGLATLEKLAAAAAEGKIVAVGTTSVRTLESLAVLGERVLLTGDAAPERTVGQWEAYTNGATADGESAPLGALAEWMRSWKMTQLHAATEIMIVPSYRWRTVRGLITNFHQPQSTLLLLISALVGERWREIYSYALEHGFRFLSYGDSSLLLPEKGSGE
ncbi:S-adenosylmethionine:tRNA ribosyltransferase-isomerase [Rikenella microfusus]|uniref:S-adenosylmethionine:tRNA ribosyltransferase-isomerase n=1 Tax=Rikenella microfusus TaxID=28139 RepID=A0A379MTW9_9BACT|nr:S-adenosylmethionine:tRNA ribosyltransferase-isomerase [Rikenella microfusus]SUE34199.1 S-adenosylmethionine:tRNA ribosyltransferase-isomerase [Rikenella microfusus]